jgi:D-tyrosyl-tRNA(Tyr) deacylase
MRAVIQRVSGARVTVGERVVGEIGRGLLVLIGVEREDQHEDVSYIASKIRDLRIFEDVAAAENGDKRMNRSVLDVKGEVLAVPQFTLLGDVRRGRRPSFDAAAPPETARFLFEEVVQALRSSGLIVGTGEFQAMMHVSLVNDGPVTILLDSRRHF